MRDPSRRRRPLRAGTVRRLAAAALAAAVLVLTPAGGSSRAPAAAAEACANVDRPVDGLSRAQARAATVCEIRRQRRLAGTRTGRPDDRLHRAARSHARAMIAKDCYQHVCPGERSIEGRLMRSGYLRGARRWSYGENIGCATTVRQMIATWLGAASSRRNLLGQRFRDIGAAVTRAVPSQAEGCSSREYGTFTVLLAVRHPR